MIAHQDPQLPTSTPSRLRLGVVAIALAGVACLGLIGLFLSYQNKILPGVEVLGIAVGNQSPADATYTVNRQLQLGNINTVALQFEDQSWEIKLTDFGFRADTDELVAAALRVGRSGDPVSDIAARLRALAQKPYAVPLEASAAYNFDKQALTEFITTEIATKIDRSAQSAKLVVQGERATDFLPDQTGRTLNVNESITALTNNLFDADPGVELVVDVAEPKVRLANTNDLGVDTLIARGVSNFKGSPKNRRHNIAVGAKKFDGLIFKPGELVSFMRELGPVDGSAGYLPELVIKKDQTTPEFGGGLCQVSTTAFRAVLNGGLKINERRNHSYRVAYYEPAGTDATVYDPYPDFKFTNDTEGHLLIDTYVQGDDLIFDFYGTDPKRTVVLDGPHISKVTAAPEPIYIDTSTIPAGEIKQIEVAHQGATAVLYRKVTAEDGKIVHDDTINSFYIPWPAKFLRGVVEAEAVETNLGNVEDEPATDTDSQEPNDSDPE